MSIKLKGGNGPVIGPSSKRDYIGSSVKHTNETIQTAGGSTNPATVIGDGVYVEYVGATYHSEGRITVAGLPDFTILNLTPNVGTISTDGSLSRVSEGFMRLLVKSSLVTFPIVIDMRDYLGAAQPRVFQAIVSGTLSEHVRYNVDSLIDNSMSMSNNGLIFSTQDHVAKIYTRNPNLWCYGYDLTCMSPWNSNAGVRKAGTLIAPRIVLGAKHYPCSKGNMIRIIGSDGVAYDRTIEQVATHPTLTQYWPDFIIYSMDSDYPSACAPCEVMPSNFGDYLVNTNDTRVPALGLDQEEKALIIDFFATGSYRTPTDADRLIFQEYKIGGDSGNPVGLLVDGKFILDTVWTSGGAGSGTPIASFIDDLNDMIVAADTLAGFSAVADPTWPNANGHYKLKEADFSTWPNFTTKNYLIGDDGAGNKSAWVNTGSTENSKPVYHKLESTGQGWKLSSNGSAWVTSNLGSPDIEHPSEISIGNEDTPDLATFSGWSFSNP